MPQAGQIELHREQDGSIDSFEDQSYFIIVISYQALL